MKKTISKKQKWITTSGYRGYYEPVFYVAGCNDTGSWDDSPCPTNVAKTELNIIRILLKRNKIKCREMVCESSNVFCVHRYLVVSEFDFGNAKEIINKEYNARLKESTMLLYVNN
jgi:hypothetical protein